MSETIKENRVVPMVMLFPHPRNYRQHPPQQITNLKKSLERFGQGRSIVVQEHENGSYTIVAGHGIYQAADELGYKELRADILPKDWTEAQVQGYLVADNLHSADATDDDELLAHLLQEQKDSGYDLAALGSSDETLRQMLQELGDGYLSAGEDEADEGEDEIPEEVETRAKPGDIWQLGRHRLLVGDCTDPIQVNRLLQGDKPVLMVTDPPYGIDYDPTWREVRGEAATPLSRGKVANDGRVDWTDAYKLSQADVAYVWHACFHSGEVAEGLKASGFEIRSQIVWVKTIFALSRSDYHWKHETCWYAVRKGVTRKWNGERNKTTVWEAPPLHSYSSEDEHTGHGTQKPLKLFIQPIENNTDPNDIVYDPFAGSGTTIIACERTNRIARCCEIEPNYANIIITRWENHTGEEATLLERSEEVAHV